VRRESTGVETQPLAPDFAGSNYYPCGRREAEKWTANYNLT